ncbi:MAG: hypothetical protein ABI147_10350, partial [Acidobacteriaceae bacterium]
SGVGEDRLSGEVGKNQKRRHRNIAGRHAAGGRSARRPHYPFPAHFRDDFGSQSRRAIYHESMDRNYDRISIVTVEDILCHNKRLDIPMSLEVLKAAQSVVQASQMDLLD